MSRTPTFVLVDGQGAVRGHSTSYDSPKGLGIDGWAWPDDPAQLKQAAQALHKEEMWAQRKLMPSLIAELISLIERSPRDADADPELEGLTARQRLGPDLLTLEERATRRSRAPSTFSERTVKAAEVAAGRPLGGQRNEAAALAPVLFTGGKVAWLTG